jgi:hypothetical protein
MQKAYVLYGTSGMGLVCMFFKTKQDALTWAQDLPGEYDLMKIKGLKYKSLKIKGIDPVVTR